MEKYTDEQMNAAFKKVQNKDNWKNPINATVDLTDEEVDILEHAVIYYTGSVAAIVKQPNGKYKVRAAGYYACIGA